MRRNEDRFPVRRTSDWSLAPNEFNVSSASPWQMMRRMQEDMDRLFGHLFGDTSGSTGLAGSSAPPAQAVQQWAPSVDVSQTNREWCIEADLPGVKKDQIEVSVQDGQLMLSAQMRQESDQGPDGTAQGDQRQYHRRERRYGYYQRVIPLPENIDERNIRCEFRNGVLTVHVPKTQQAQQGPRRIPIYDVDHLPSETASGRQRSEAELEMTEDEDAPAMAGAKGGERMASSSAAKQQPAGGASTGEASRAKPKNGPRTKSGKQ